MIRQSIFGKILAGIASSFPWNCGRTPSLPYHPLADDTFAVPDDKPRYGPGSVPTPPRRPFGDRVHKSVPIIGENNLGYWSQERNPNYR